eukprot:TRINITY_DN6523_c0_g1_i1.p1 TRINITY_DN6523_c0_g1~~TRINITY_DN6523_c0_g1_i1.p1  ORF type:complete len:1042 (-),score=210.27 TRINITY_DN6523_c0_g1_i1:382-3507(-)
MPLSSFAPALVRAFRVDSIDGDSTGDGDDSEVSDDVSDSDDSDVEDGSKPTIWHSLSSGKSHLFGQPLLSGLSAKQLRRIQSHYSLSGGGARFYNSYSTAMRNFTIAFRVALWTALFALPGYTKTFGHLIFGQRYVSPIVAEATNLTVGTHLCRKQDHGRMVNIGMGKEIFLIPYNQSTAWDGCTYGEKCIDNPNDVWCGLLPDLYQVYWPNVAQMVIFTVFQNTGTTVQLAWQGVLGTLLATANIWVMQWIYPEGAIRLTAEEFKTRVEMRPQISHFRHVNVSCEEAWWEKHLGEVVGILDNQENCGNYYLDETYNQWLALGNFVGVAGLICLSKAAQNTMMFGLMWHSYYMMNFMNPRYGMSIGYFPSPIPRFEFDSEYFCVVMTSLLGTLIGVLATVFPRPVSGISQIRTDTTLIVNAKHSILQDALDYMRGNETTALRFQIENKIRKLSGLRSKVDSNLAASWWETFNLGHYREMRYMSDKFDDVCGQCQEFMSVILGCCFTETFEEGHRQWTERYGDVLQELLDRTQALRAVIADACNMGFQEPGQRETVQHLVNMVKDTQTRLMILYKESHYRVSQHSNECCFVYVLSCVSLSLTDFCEEMIKLDLREDLDCCIVRIWGYAKDGFLRTWDPKRMFKAQNLNFAFRNTLAITIVFCMALYIPSGATDENTVFVQYNTVMPMTLSLLLSHYSGSAFYRNLQRLLGVVMGKTLPIFIINSLACIRCGTWLHTAVHISFIMAWILAFCYVYYSSARYSLMACLTAAFGVPLLMFSCMEDHDTGGAMIGSYSVKYMEIGQVTAAIAIQALVDFIFIPEAPRTKANRLLGELLGLLRDGFRAMFDEDILTMKECSDKAAKVLGVCAGTGVGGLVFETDPSNQTVQGLGVPFKHSAYKHGLDYLSNIHAYLATLCITCSEKKKLKKPGKVLKWLCAAEAIGPVRDELLRQLALSFDAFLAVIAHDTELPNKDKALASLAGHTLELPGRKPLYREMDAVLDKEANDDDMATNQRARVCVTIKSLRMILHNLTSLDEISIAQNI